MPHKLQKPTLFALLTSTLIWGCNGAPATPEAVSAATPYLRLAVREPDRTALLTVAGQLQNGQFDTAAGQIERIEVPNTVHVSVTADGEQAADAKAAAEEAVKTWNDALKGAVKFETGAGAGDADLNITFQASVTEVFPNYTAPGCSNIRISSDTQSGDTRKAELQIAYSRPGGSTPHTKASFAHLVAKGIGSYLGLERSQQMNQLMGPDTHMDTVPASPSEEDVKTVLQRLHYEKALAEAASAKAKPKIEFPAMQMDAMEKDAGEVWRGEKAKVEFAFKNTGQAPLELDVKPACGCTIAKFDKVVAPGAAGKIEIDFNTAGYNGPSSKHIDIFSNSPGGEKVKLSLKTNVKPTFETTPKGFQVVPVAESGPSSYEFTVKPLEPEPAKVLSVTSQSKYLAGTVEPAGDVFKVKMAVSPDLPAGRTVQTVRVKTDSKREPEFNVTLALDKGICLVPSACYFGMLKPDQQYPVQRNIQVIRHGRPFKIVKVDTGDPKLTGNVLTTKPGEEYILQLAYAGGWPAGNVQRVVILQTDDPKQPKVELTIQANVGG